MNRRNDAAAKSLKAHPLRQQQKTGPLPPQQRVPQFKSLPFRKPTSAPLVQVPQPRTGALQTKLPRETAKPLLARMHHAGAVAPRIATRPPGAPAPPRVPVAYGKPTLNQVSRVALPVRPVGKLKTIQRFRSSIVQATKYYPNLHPGAVEPIDSSNIFRLNSFANQYRLHRVHSHGVNVPNQQYNFVRTREGEMLLHARYRHPSIAEGKQVLYAGEIFFNNGQLEWWSNGSGHYQPYAEDAAQANLPMDYFFSFQQVIKGEHTRKKG